MASKSQDLLGSLTGLTERLSEAVNVTNTGAEEPKETEKKKRYRETRSKCFQMRMKPSLFDSLEQQAEREGRSINNLIEIAIEDYLKEKNN